jgi:5-methyltetrahydropteroyltriglutamate--homocysteine methyltransferase
MERSTSRILTTHVGCLQRPLYLAEAMAAQGGVAPPDPLRKAVAEVVQRQVEAGVDVVDDGEYGKTIWQWYVTERLTGFERRPFEEPIFKGRDRDLFPKFYEFADRNVPRSLFYKDENEPDPWFGAITTQPVCVGEIRYRPEAVQRDIENLQAALSGSGAVEAFYPVAAPISVAVAMKNEHYPSEEEFLWALAEAMKEEYRAIIDAGLVLQVDDAWLPALWDREADLDLTTYRGRCEGYIEALNHSLAGLPEDRIRYHLCWGSWHGPHVSDVPLADIVDLMLKVKAAAYSVEAANVRHEHEYHLWERVRLPEGKVLIPGVVTHSTNLIETPGLVAERIVQYAERVGKENVIASTDCGFGARIHPELGWAKLRALAEGAELATRSLWGTRTATPVG